MTISKQWEPQTDSDFEQTYKTSYSHGLELIYALEKVNIRSVRKINDPPPLQIDKPVETSTHFWAEEIDDQLKLNFGDSYLGLMDSFLLREPIQVLRLSRRIESTLLLQGKKNIENLLESDLKTVVPLTGLGQGHIDEVYTKLHSYLQGRDLHKTKTINLSSWLKTIIADLDPKKVFVALESFELSNLVPLSSAEGVEVRLLTPEKRNAWADEALSLFREKAKVDQVHADMRKIVDVFIIPWLYGRLHMATESQLNERLLRISEPQEEALQILAWMKFTYFDDQFPFLKFLSPAEHQLYCSDLLTVNAYKEVVKIAKTYFYKADLYYSLPSLVEWITHECSRVWKNFPERFIERALRLSPHFRIRKDHSGQLIVRSI